MPDDTNMNPNDEDQGQGTGRGWHGDPQGHAEAGRQGGMSQGQANNPANFARDPAKASRAGRKGGKARRRSRSNM